MDYKKFFWATKEKTLLTLGLFILLNIFAFPSVQNVYCSIGEECPPQTDFNNIFNSLTAPTFVSIDFSYEIVYIGFSYLAACIFFHLKKGGN